MENRLVTRDGRLTANSLALGYEESKETSVYRVSLRDEAEVLRGTPIYHVRARDQLNHTVVFDAVFSSLDEARTAFDTLIKVP